ncbi:MAG: tRNA dihydrouridine synthase DusB [Firmicutes bacterium]|nr:tRNA dihydrouridine synthase DusB [Bacillota bacterium]
MGVFLAPMAGVTDLPFRLLAREMGADLVVSEMISARALLNNNPKTLAMLAIHPLERPIAIQLFGHDPRIMAAAAQIALEQSSPEIIDLNFGCPTPKIVKNGDGAALLKNPPLLEKIAAEVVQAVSIPVTAKIRLGWDRENINCLEVARRLESSGVGWITVHGRTRDQFYAGKADWNWIARIKSKSGVPIVGNGDVFSAQDARDLLAKTNCDHLAVGRGARGNPWIFKQIKANLNQGKTLPEPTREEKINLALRHLKMKIDYEGEQKAVREMRSHLAWYLRGIPGSASVRREINSAPDFAALENLLKSVL